MVMHFWVRLLPATKHGSTTTLSSQNNPAWNGEKETKHLQWKPWLDCQLWSSFQMFFFYQWGILFNDFLQQRHAIMLFIIESYWPRWEMYIAAKDQTNWIKKSSFITPTPDHIAALKLQNWKKCSGLNLNILRSAGTYRPAMFICLGHSRKLSGSNDLKIMKVWRSLCAIGSWSNLG